MAGCARRATEHRGRYRPPAGRAARRRAEDEEEGAGRATRHQDKDQDTNGQEARGAPVARRAAPEPPQVHSLHIDSRTVAAFYTKPSQDVEAPGASTSSLGFVVGHRMDAYMVWPQK
jgi:hypothetical protein